MNVSGFNKVLQLSPNQDRAVHYIQIEFRNQFVHYRPASWSIELAGLPEIVGHGLDVIGSIALAMGSYYTHHNRERISSLIAEGKNAIGQLQNASTV